MANGRYLSRLKSIVRCKVYSKVVDTLAIMEKHFAPLTAVSLNVVYVGVVKQFTLTYMFVQQS